MIKIKKILIDSTKVYVDIEPNKLLYDYTYNLNSWNYPNALIVLDPDKFTTYKVLLKKYKRYLRVMISKRERLKSKLPFDYYFYLGEIKKLTQYFRLVKAVRSILAVQGIVII